MAEGSRGTGVVKLLDHFRPPLSVRRQGAAFLGAWATYLSADFNQQLPADHVAQPYVRHRIPLDRAAEYETPPIRSITLPLAESVVEIRIFSQFGGPEFTGAIELVSPANKDRPASREAFLNKCLTYLQHGIGLVVVDIVTDRAADLHREMLARLGHAAVDTGTSLYAAAYRPVERDGAAALDIWHEPLRVGGDLPTMPLWLRGDLCITVDLAGTYNRTCLEQRVPTVEV